MHPVSSFALARHKIILLPIGPILVNKLIDFQCEHIAKRNHFPNLQRLFKVPIKKKSVKKKFITASKLIQFKFEGVQINLDEIEQSLYHKIKAGNPEIG